MYNFRAMFRIPTILILLQHEGCDEGHYVETKLAKGEGENVEHNEGDATGTKFDKGN